MLSYAYEKRNVKDQKNNIKILSYKISCIHTNHNLIQLHTQYFLRLNSYLSYFTILLITSSQYFYL